MENMDNEAIERNTQVSEEEGRSDEPHEAPAAQDEEIKASEDVDKETNQAFLKEGRFIVANFNKNSDEVKLVCRVKSIWLDGCDVVIMKPISRIGLVYSENMKDVRKIKFNQICKGLATPRKFGSNFQFSASDFI
uniref:Uncharacterized protein n=1 Tax=Lygus hesperus TaxID=30085 RepID=A0A0K8S9Z9_LYGHE